MKGRGTRRHIPMRLCLGCEESKPKRELVRIVRTPDGLVELDLTGKRSGRGAYVCPQESCLEKAAKGKRLDKALGKEIGPEVLAAIREKIARARGVTLG